MDSQFTDARPRIGFHVRRRLMRAFAISQNQDTPAKGLHARICRLEAGNVAEFVGVGPTRGHAL